MGLSHDYLEVQTEALFLVPNFCLSLMNFLVSTKIKCICYFSFWHVTPGFLSAPAGCLLAQNLQEFN